MSSLSLACPARGPRVTRPLIALAFMLCLVGCTRDKRPEAVEWPVMGTQAAFRCREARLLPCADDVRAVFKDIETRLSAHDPQSELNRLKALDDAALLEQCDARDRPCYEAAFRFRDATGGAFNPRYRGPGTLDLGAIAKGFALDVAAAALVHEEVLLDLGGNLKACGGVWRIGILGGTETLVLTNGMACATSGAYYRGAHIKDGRTGAAAQPDALSVTVVHPNSAMIADALSTTLYILGREAGEAFLKAHYPEARAIWLNAPRTEP